MFRDRRLAGEQLAKALRHFKNEDAVVLALPRGGAPVAYEVARQLGLPLDVMVCRKLGVPGHDEYAFGAIAEGGVRFIDEEIVRSLGLSATQIEMVQNQESKTLQDRVQLFRPTAKGLNLIGKTALLIDDGVATGATARAACLAAKKMGAKRVVVGVPVGPIGTEASIREADEVVCLSHPALFMAVGNHYEQFEQVSDDEVLQILERARGAI